MGDKLQSTYCSAARSALKVIWNITSKCVYHCAVCATHDAARVELTLAEKRRVLRNLTAGADVVSLDFAGGDPLCDADSRVVIKEAVELLGSERVCVTTTGRSIAALGDAEKSLLLKNCELTIDSDGSGGDMRGESSYSGSNYRAAVDNAAYFKNLTVNVPVIDCRATDEKIAGIAGLINNIPTRKFVSLIRLMPVGSMRSGDYPADYDPQRYIDLFSQLLDKTATLHLHCALRGRYAGECDNCGLAKRKIGIDCAGNVFACAWAGYLGAEPADNPYYLGNLVSESVQQIFSGRRVRELQALAGNTSGRCSIFSYLSAGSPDAGVDPLFDK